MSGQRTPYQKGLTLEEASAEAHAQRVAFVDGVPGDRALSEELGEYHPLIRRLRAIRSRVKELIQAYLSGLAAMEVDNLLARRLRAIIGAVEEINRVLSSAVAAIQAENRATATAATNRTAAAGDDPIHNIDPDIKSSEMSAILDRLDSGGMVTIRLPSISRPASHQRPRISFRRSSANLSTSNNNATSAESCRYRKLAVRPEAEGENDNFGGLAGSQQPDLGHSSIGYENGTMESGLGNRFPTPNYGGPGYFPDPNQNVNLAPSPPMNLVANSSSSREHVNLSGIRLPLRFQTDYRSPYTQNLKYSGAKGYPHGRGGYGYGDVGDLIPGTLVGASGPSTYAPLPSHNYTKPPQHEQFNDGNGCTPGDFSNDRDKNQLHTELLEEEYLNPEAYWEWLDKTYPQEAVENQKEGNRM